MLELEIQKLREEITGLRDAMDALSAVMLGATHAMLPGKVEIATAPVATPEPAPVATPEPAPETPAPAAAITVDDVQALCSAMVRENESIKPKIKALIQTFDGAKTLSIVAPSRLPELKAALEALQ